MDEDVFLVFVPFGLVLAAFALFLVRRWEEQMCWERFRISTIVWTTVITMTVAGFVNMSDAVFLLVAWVILSGFLILKVTRGQAHLSIKRQVLWMLLLLTPGGWILFFQRFPHIHGLDAAAVQQVGN